MKSFKQNAKLNKLTGKLMKAALLAFVFAMSFFVCLASLTSGGTNPVSNMVNEIIDSIDDGAPENGSVQVAEAGCGPQQTYSMPNLNTTYTIYAQNETSGGTGNETTISGNVTLSQNHIYAIKNGVIQITLSYRISNPSSNNQQWGVSFDNASSWGLNMSNKSEGTYTSSATTIPTSFAYSHLRFRTIVSASFLNPAETNDMTARLTTTDSTNPYISDTSIATTYGTNSVITFYDAGAGIDTVTYTRDGGSSQSASLSYSADRKTATFSTNIGGAYNFTITDNVGRTAYDSRTIPRRFQIAFNGNGATSGSMSNMQCLTERSYTLTANAFSRTGGYSFAGWNTAADGSGTNYSNQQQINFNFTTVTSDNMTITLYAKWVFTYTLTYNANTSPGTSSVSGTVPSNQIVTNGSAYTIGGSLSRNGYRFLGWSRTSGYVAHDGSWSANGTSRFLASTQYSLMVEGATPGATLTLYAVWQYNSYTVTYGANKPSAARSSVTGSMANTLHVYDTAQNLRSNAYALAGYTFLGWSTNAVTTAVQNLTDAGGTTYTNSQSVNNILTGHGGTYNLYAVWRANTYQIQVNYGGSTSGSVTVNGTTIANGASTSAIASDVTVTLARTLARTGYNFVGWRVTGTYSTSTFYWGTSSGGMSTQLAATAYPTGFSTNSSVANGLNAYSTTTLYAVNMSSTNSSMTVITAVWSPITYTIVYNSNKPASASTAISGSTTSSSHVYGIAQNLTMNGYSLPGYTFQNWNTAANGSGTTYTNGQSVNNLTTTNGATLNFYAQWSANYIQVTLYYGESWGSTYTRYVRFDSKNVYLNADGTGASSFPVLSNLTKYEFYGYSLENNTTGSSIISNAMTNTSAVLINNWTSTDATSLYAIWRYRIAYNAGIGSGGQTGYYDYYKSTSSTANSYYNGSGFSRDRATLQGWTTSSLPGYSSQYGLGANHNTNAFSGISTILYGYWLGTGNINYGPSGIPSNLNLTQGSEPRYLHGETYLNYDGATHTTNLGNSNETYRRWGVFFYQCASNELERGTYTQGAQGEAPDNAIGYDTGVVMVVDPRYGMFWMDLSIGDNLKAALSKGAISLTFSCNSGGSGSTTLYPFIAGGYSGNGNFYSFINDTISHGSAATAGGNLSASITIPQGSQNYNTIRVGVFVKWDGGWFDHFDGWIYNPKIEIFNSAATYFDSAGNGSVNPTSYAANNSSYTVETSITSAATPNAGYYFLYWTQSSTAVAHTRTIAMRTYYDGTPNKQPNYIPNGTYTATFAQISFWFNGVSYTSSTYTGQTLYILRSDFKTLDSGRGINIGVSGSISAGYSTTSASIGSTFGGYVNPEQVMSAGNYPAEGTDYTIYLQYKDTAGIVCGQLAVNFQIINSDFGTKAGGTGKWGSATNPYMIDSALHLVNLSNIVNNVRQPLNSVSGNWTGNGFTIASSGVQASSRTFAGSFFEVSQNITVSSGSMMPIGSDATYTFRADFNGTGKTINLNTFAGLFGYVTGESASVRTKIHDLTVQGAVSGVTTPAGLATAGIVGYAENCELYNLTNAAAVTGTSSYTGGIVGYAVSANVYLYGNLTNSGNISGGSFVGGVGGRTHCNFYNPADTSAYGTFRNSGSVTGSGNSVGGIFGFSDKTIKNATNMASGNVVGLYYVGGISGRSQGAIESCTNGGSVTATSYVTNGEAENLVGSFAGGITGYQLSHNITSCTNSGYIQSTSASYNDYVGGITGYSKLPVNDSINTSSGAVNGGSYVAGIVGRLLAGVSISGNSNAAAITATGSYVGGIVGLMIGGSLTGAYAGGTSYYTNTGAILGGNYVGGIIGEYSLSSSANTMIRSVCNTGAVRLTSAAGTAVGGIIGRITASGSATGILYVGDPSSLSTNYYVSNSGNINTVTPTTSATGVGGIVGYIAEGTGTTNKVSVYIGGGSDTKRVLNSGVTANNANSGLFHGVGGIVGYIAATSLDKIDVTVKFCTSSSQTRTGANSQGAGGIVGTVEAGGASLGGYTVKIDNCKKSDFIVGAHYVGGIVGKGENVQITACELTNGIIRGMGGTSEDGYVGGIAGYLLSSAVSTTSVLSSDTIAGCNTSSYADTDTYFNYVGGYVGRMVASSLSLPATVTGISRPLHGKSNVGGVVGAMDVDAAGGISSLTFAANFTKTGAILHSQLYVGGIVGRATSLNLSGTYYNNTITFGGLTLINNGAITSQSTSAEAFVGGLFGFIQRMTLAGTLIRNTANITAAGGNVGGIYGRAQDSTMNTPLENGTSGTAAKIQGTTEVGGIGGRGYGTSQNRNATNYMEISATGTRAGGLYGAINWSGLSASYVYNNHAKVSGTDRVGGIAGEVTANTSGALRGECYNYGQIAATGSYIGGIVGYVGAGSTYIPIVTITKAANYAAVSGANYVGGLIGYAEPTATVTISNFYNAATATITASASYAGGVAGSIDDGDTIAYSVNDANVSAATNYAGGIAGRLNGTASISYCYNTKGLGTVSSSGVEGGIAGLKGASATVTACWAFYANADNDISIPAGDTVLSGVGAGVVYVSAAVTEGSAMTAVPCSSGGSNLSWADILNNNIAYFKLTGQAGAPSTTNPSGYYFRMANASANSVDSASWYSLALNGSTVEAVYAASNATYNNSQGIYAKYGRPTVADRETYCAAPITPAVTTMPQESTSGQTNRSYTWEFTFYNSVANRTSDTNPMSQIENARTYYYRLRIYSSSGGVLMGTYHGLFIIDPMPVTLNIITTGSGYTLNPSYGADTYSRVYDGTSKGVSVSATLNGVTYYDDDLMGGGTAFITVSYQVTAFAYQGVARIGYNHTTIKKPTGAGKYQLNVAFTGELGDDNYTISGLYDVYLVIEPAPLTMRNDGEYHATDGTAFFTITNTDKQYDRTNTFNGNISLGFLPVTGNDDPLANRQIYSDNYTIDSGSKVYSSLNAGARTISYTATWKQRNQGQVGFGAFNNYCIVKGGTPWTPETPTNFTTSKTYNIYKKILNFNKTYFVLQTTTMPFNNTATFTDAVLNITAAGVANCGLVPGDTTVPLDYGINSFKAEFNDKLIGGKTLYYRIKLNSSGDVVNYCTARQQSGSDGNYSYIYNYDIPLSTDPDAVQFSGEYWYSTPGTITKRLLNIQINGPVWNSAALKKEKLYDGTDFFQTAYDPSFISVTGFAGDVLSFPTVSGKFYSSSSSAVEPYCAYQVGSYYVKFAVTIGQLQSSFSPSDIYSGYASFWDYYTFPNTDPAGYYYVSTTTQHQIQPRNVYAKAEGYVNSWANLTYSESLNAYTACSLAQPQVAWQSGGLSSYTYNTVAPLIVWSMPTVGIYYGNAIGESDSEKLVTVRDKRLFSDTSSSTRYDNVWANATLFSGISGSSLTGKNLTAINGTTYGYGGTNLGTDASGQDRYWIMNGYAMQVRYNEYMLVNDNYNVAAAADGCTFNIVHNASASGIDSSPNGGSSARVHTYTASETFDNYPSGISKQITAGNTESAGTYANYVNMINAASGSGLGVGWVRIGDWPFSRPYGFGLNSDEPASGSLVMWMDVDLRPGGGVSLAANGRLIAELSVYNYVFGRADGLTMGIAYIDGSGAKIKPTGTVSDMNASVPGVKTEVLEITGKGGWFNITCSVPADCTGIRLIFHFSNPVGGWGEIFNQATLTLRQADTYSNIHEQQTTVVHNQSGSGAGVIGWQGEMSQNPDGAMLKYANPTGSGALNYYWWATSNSSLNVTNTSNPGFHSGSNVGGIFGIKIRLSGDLAYYANLGKLRISIELELQARSGINTRLGVARLGDVSYGTVLGIGSIQTYDHFVYGFVATSNGNNKLALYNMFFEPGLGESNYVYSVYIEAANTQTMEAYINSLRIRYDIMNDLVIGNEDNITANYNLATNLDDSHRWYYYTGDKYIALTEFVGDNIEVRPDIYGNYSGGNCNNMTGMLGFGPTVYWLFGAVQWSGNWLGDPFNANVKVGTNIVLSDKITRAIEYGNVSLTISFKIYFYLSSDFISERPEIYHFDISNGLLTGSGARYEYSPPTNAKWSETPGLASNEISATVTYTASELRSIINGNYMNLWWFIQGKGRGNNYFYLHSVNVAFTGTQAASVADQQTTSSSSASNITASTPTYTIGGVSHTVTYTVTNFDSSWASSQDWHITFTSNNAADPLWAPSVWVTVGGQPRYLDFSSFLTYNRTSFLAAGSGDTAGIVVEATFTENFRVLTLRIQNIYSIPTINVQARTCNNRASNVLTKNYGTVKLDSKAPDVQIETTNLDNWTTPIDGANPTPDDIAAGKVMRVYFSDHGLHPDTQTSLNRTSGFKTIAAYRMDYTDGAYSWVAEQGGKWYYMNQWSVWTALPQDFTFAYVYQNCYNTTFEGYYLMYERYCDVNTTFYFAAYDNAGNCSLYPKYDPYTLGTITPDFSTSNITTGNIIVNSVANIYGVNFSGISEGQTLANISSYNLLSINVPTDGTFVFRAYPIEQTSGVRSYIHVFDQSGLCVGTDFAVDGVAQVTLQNCTEGQKFYYAATTDYTVVNAINRIASDGSANGTNTSETIVLNAGGVTGMKSFTAKVAGNYTFISFPSALGYATLDVYKSDGTLIDSLSGDSVNESGRLLITLSLEAGETILFTSAFTKNELVGNMSRDVFSFNSGLIEGERLHDVDGTYANYYGFNVNEQYMTPADTAAMMAKLGADAPIINIDGTDTAGRFSFTLNTSETDNYYLYIYKKNAGDTGATIYSTGAMQAAGNTYSRSVTLSDAGQYYYLFVRKSGESGSATNEIDFMYLASKYNIYNVDFRNISQGSTISVDQVAGLNYCRMAYTGDYTITVAPSAVPALVAATYHFYLFYDNGSTITCVRYASASVSSGNPTFSVIYNITSGTRGDYYYAVCRDTTSGASGNWATIDEAKCFVTVAIPASAAASMTTTVENAPMLSMLWAVSSIRDYSSVDYTVTGAISGTLNLHDTSNPYGQIIYGLTTESEPIDITNLIKFNADATGEYTFTAYATQSFPSTVFYIYIFDQNGYLVYDPVSMTGATQSNPLVMDGIDMIAGRTYYLALGSNSTQSMTINWEAMVAVIIYHKGEDGIFSIASADELDEFDYLHILLDSGYKTEITKIYAETLTFGAADVHKEGAGLVVSAITGVIQIQYDMGVGYYPAAELHLPTNDDHDNPGFREPETIYLRAGSEAQMLTMLPGYYFVGWAYTIQSTNIANFVYPAAYGPQIQNGSFSGQKLWLSGTWQDPLAASIPSYTSAVNPHDGIEIPITMATRATILIRALFTKIVGDYSDNVEVAGINRTYINNDAYGESVYDGNLKKVRFEDSYDIAGIAASQFTLRGLYGFSHDLTRVAASYYNTLGGTTPAPNNIMTFGSSTTNPRHQDVGQRSTVINLYRKVTVAGAEYWTYAGSREMTMRIVPKALTSNWPAGTKSQVYTGAELSHQAGVLGVISGDDVYFTFTGHKATLVGNYNAVISGLGGANANNYSLPVSGLTSTWQITELVVSVHWTGTTSSYTYNGLNQGASIGAYIVGVGQDTGNISLNVTFLRTTNTTPWGSLNQFRYAGLYTITAVEPEDSLFDNYGLAPGEVTITGFEMQKLVSSYKWYIANSQISSGAYLPYEGNASGEYLATTGYNGYAWTVKPNVNNLASGDTQSSFTYTYGSGTYSATAAGNYTATLTGWNNSNYTLTGTTSFDWVIHARVLNVNPVAGAWDISKIYDGTNFYRYSDDTYPTTVANPLQFTLNTHYTVSPADPSLGVVSIDIDIREALFTGINAGLYTNNVRVYYMLYAQDENNYVIEDASGAGYISFTGTILPKQLSATWPTQSSFPYNGGQQDYTPNIIGRVTVSGTVDDVNFVLTGNVATNAGDYTCTITGLSGSKSANYDMPIASECSGSWSITKISRAVQWSALSVFTYNSQNQGNSVTAWIIGAGDDGNLSLNVTFSGKATTFREAGSYTATASAGATPAELVNYNITAPLTKALTMNPALVVFNWSGSLTPVYNATARTVTATVAASSVFGSDVVTVTAYNNTGTQVAGSSPARYYHNSATDAAYYRAEVTGISNPNYTFTTAATRYVDWRISPAALRLTANNQTFVYNGKYSAPTLSQSNAYSVSLGQIYTRDAGSMFISVSYTASANLFDVGTHNGYIRVTASNSNYDIETVNGALIITKRPIYIQTDAMPWIYNYNMSNFYGSYDNTDKTVFDFANNDISSKLLITNTIDDDVFVINIYFVNQDEGYTDGCVNAVTGATGDPENLDNELLVGRTLHIIRFTLSGDDAYNYLFNYDDTDEEGNLNLYEEDEVGGLISPRELLLGPSYNFRKTYNGTSNLQILSGGTDTVAFSWSFADGAGPLEGVEGAEDVHLTGVVISNGAAGNRTVTSFIITGTAAGNYYLNAPTGGSAYTAVVLKRTVTVEGVLGEDTTISKYYDGTVNYGGSINSSYYTINNVVNGDVLGVNVSSIQFDKSNVLASSAVVYFSITDTVNYQPSSTYFALLGEIVPVTFTVTPVSGLHKLYDRSAWLWSPSGKDSEEIAAVMTYAAAIVEGNTWQGYLTISGTAPYPAGNGYTIVKHGTNPIKLEDAEGVENYIVQLATDVTYTIDKRPIEVTYTNLLQSYRVELVAVGYSSAGGILAEDASDITIDIKNGWLNETYNSLTIIQGSELSNRLGCSLIETQTAESYFIATQPRLVIGYFISAGGEAVERFKVETLEDLLEVGDAYKTGYYGAFVLMNDISGLVNGSATLWTPIAGTADQGYSFMGEFDGGGFTVSDLIIANTAASTSGSYANVGFFASLMGGIVMNLNLRNVTINSYSDFANVGGIAGRSVQGQILDSSFEGKITVRAMSANVGGIAGYATNDSAVGLDRQLQFVSRPNFENLTAVAEILFNGRAGGFESTIGGLIGLAEGIATEAVSISGSFSFADTTLRLATGTTNYAGNLIGKLLFAETDIDTNKFLAAAVGNTRSGVTLNGSSAQVGMVSAAVGNGASLPASALSYNAIAAAAEFGEDLNAEGCIIEIIMNYVLRSDYYYLPAEVFEEFEDSGTVYGTSTNPFEISSYRHIPLLSVYKWASFSLTSDIRLPNSFAAATAEYCYYGALFVNAGGYKLLNANAPAGGTPLFVYATSGLPNVTNN